MPLKALQNVFGGRGVNYTKARVIEESTLIEVYRNCQGNVERNFGLTSLSVQHAPQNMAKTFATLMAYMREHGPNEYRQGRATCHTIPAMLSDGLRRITAGEAPGSSAGESGADNDIEHQASAEDLAVDE